MIGAHEPDFYFIAGAPGSGKSSEVHYQLMSAPASRRLIFDPLGQYRRYGKAFTSVEDLRRALIAAGTGPLSFVLVPNGDDEAHERRQFDAFCKLAYAVLPVQVVVDELADVTSPNPYLVPPGWARLLRKGRNMGLRVLAASQRPADVDKKVRTFATRVRAGRLADYDDVTLIRKMLRAPFDEVNALVGTEWIECNRLTGAIARGRIEWQRGRPVNVARAAPGQAAPLQKKVTGARRAQ